MSAFQVKLGTNDLNCVDMPLNPTHSLFAIYLKKVMNFLEGLKCGLGNYQLDSDGNPHPFPYFVSFFTTAMYCQWGRNSLPLFARWLH